MTPVVLLVEDEESIVTLVRYNLEADGYRVIEARDGEEAMLRVEEEQPELVILDWMLPLLSGVEVCRRIRRSSHFRDLPIIMLTARSEEMDKIRGLDAGADDYLTKPFSPAELVARVRALLRRRHPEGFSESLAFADLEMDLAAHRVRRGEREVHLGPTEYRLLRHFLQRPGRSNPHRAVRRLRIGSGGCLRLAFQRLQVGGLGLVAEDSEHNPLQGLVSGEISADRADRQFGSRL